MKKINGIASKLIVGVILFGLLLGAVCSTVGYTEFTAVLEQQYNDSAYEIAETAREIVNPDKFEQYLKTGQTDEEYDDILARLDTLTNMTNVTFIYVAKVSEDYKTLTYIYDTVNSSTGFSRYPLGYTASDLDEKYTENVVKIMTEGGRAEKYLYSYSKESGAHTTAAIDVKNSDGEIIAMLCVEKPMTRLENARNAYVLHVVLWTLLVIVLFILVYTLILRRSIIKPIIAVANETNRFAETNTSSDQLLGIKKKDEIGILARAVDKMEKDIVEYTKNLTAITAEKERINTELNVATQIQADMLPSIFPAFPERKEFDIYATMTPAKEVGGDFYDFFLIDDDHLALVMADVSGKGVPAALFMVIAKTLIKNHAQLGEYSPAKVLARVNEQLCERNEAELFVTVWLAILEISSGKGKAANAGHEHPVLCRSGGKYELVEYRHSPAVAIMEGIRFREHEFQMYPGDSLFVYTDGVAEASDAKDELYGTKRMLNALNKAPDKSPKEILRAVKLDVDGFVGSAPQFDDITMLGFTYFGTENNR